MIPEGIAWQPHAYGRHASDENCTGCPFGGHSNGNRCIDRLYTGNSMVFISLCLGFAGGAMLYITCSELIPESRDLYPGRISGVGLILGILLGIIMTKLI